MTQSTCPIDRMCNVRAEVLQMLSPSGKDKFVTAGILGYGSCFYHSILLCMNYREYMDSSRKQKSDQVEKLRAELSNTVHGNWDNFWDNTVKKELRYRIPSEKKAYDDIRNTKIWANIYHIMFFVNYFMRHVWSLKTNVLFIDGASDPPSFFCGTDNFKDTDYTILIYWSNRSHFEPIGKVSKSDNSRICFKFRNKGKGSSLVKRIRDMYFMIGPCRKISINDVV